MDRNEPTVTMDFSLFRKSKAVVGLDIGSSAVKAVELKPAGKGGYKVAAFASEPVPPDTIVDGTIVDGVAVASAIRRIFESKRFKAKDVVASLSGNAVIVKKIALPVMSDAELAESIHWEAEQYIPFDIQDVNLDYQLLEDLPGEGGKQTMDVLLVAAKRDKIAEYTGVIAQAGRSTVVVDIDAFAVQNCFETNYGLDGGVSVLLNAGASAINVNIVAGDQSLFTRDISVGGNAYTEAVQREFNLAFDVAEQAKKGHPVEGVPFEDVRLGAAHDERVGRAGNPEDLRLLQGDDLAGPDRSHRPLRRRQPGGRLRGTARGALRRAGRGARPVQDRHHRGGPPRHLEPGRHGADGGGRRRPRAQSSGGPMIRINLLATEREKQPRKKSGIAFDIGQKVTLLSSLILVATVLGIGWWWWMLDRESARLTSDIASAERETARLKTILSQVATFEKQKQQLQERVKLIEELRRGQTGPVHMIDELSKAMPEMLWLTELKQDAGDVTIEGRCTTLTALSDFVGNLERSGYFKRPVEILDSQVEAAAPTKAS